MREVADAWGDRVFKISANDDLSECSDPSPPRGPPPARSRQLARRTRLPASRPTSPRRGSPIRLPLARIAIFETHPRCRSSRGRLRGEDTLSLPALPFRLDLQG